MKAGDKGGAAQGRGGTAVGGAGRPPIPLALVTGFLGAGKTTLLRRVIEVYRDRRFVYLVNDFASVGVDTRRLQDTGADVVSIPGGSIFCRCLVTEFVGSLRRVAEVFDRPETPVEAVIVEASGMADPSALDDLLAECRLDARFAVRSVTTLVDPGSFGKLLATLPNIRRQVEAADQVVVNKCDLFSGDEVEAVEAAVREIQPEVHILRAVRAEIDLSTLFGAHGGGRHGELAPCRDPHYEAHTVDLPAAVTIEDLRARIEQAGDAIYRAKGLVRTPGGPVDVDWSAGRFEARPWTGATDAPPTLAIIFRGTPEPGLVNRVAGADFARIDGSAGRGCRKARRAEDRLAAHRPCVGGGKR